MFDHVSNAIKRIYQAPVEADAWSPLIENLFAMIDGLESSSNSATKLARAEQALLSWISPHIEESMKQQAALFKQKEIIAFQDSLLDQHYFGIALFESQRIVWRNASMATLLSTLPERQLHEILTASNNSSTVVRTHDGIILVALSAPTFGIESKILLASSLNGIDLNRGLLKEIFGFNDQQADIAWYLTKGEMPKQIADHLKIFNEEKVRNLIKQIKALVKEKSGVKNVGIQNKLIICRSLDLILQ